VKKNRSCLASHLKHTENGSGDLCRDLKIITIFGFHLSRILENLFLAHFESCRSQNFKSRKVLLGKPTSWDNHYLQVQSHRHKRLLGYV
jgi:hypothetical protein